MLASAICAHAQCHNQGQCGGHHECCSEGQSLEGKSCVTTIHSKIAGSQMRMIVEFTSDDSCKVVFINEDMRTEYGTRAAILSFLHAPAKYTVTDKHLTLDYATDKATLELQSAILGDPAPNVKERIENALNREINAAHSHLLKDYIAFLPEVTSMTINYIENKDVNLSLDNLPERFPNMDGSRIRP